MHCYYHHEFTSTNIEICRCVEVGLDAEGQYSSPNRTIHASRCSTGAKEIIRMTVNFLDPDANDSEDLPSKTPTMSIPLITTHCRFAARITLQL